MIGLREVRVASAPCIQEAVQIRRLKSALVRTCIDLENNHTLQMAAALSYVDGHLPRLFAALQRRAPTLAILCSDHGTAYGDEGYTGHRHPLPCVVHVPYAEMRLPRVP